MLTLYKKQVKDIQTHSFQIVNINNTNDRREHGHLPDDVFMRVSLSGCSRASRALRSTGLASSEWLHPEIAVAVALHHAEHRGELVVVFTDTAPRCGCGSGCGGSSFHLFDGVTGIEIVPRLQIERAVVLLITCRIRPCALKMTSGILPTASGRDEPRWVIRAVAISCREWLWCNANGPELPLVSTADCRGVPVSVGSRCTVASSGSATGPYGLLIGMRNILHSPLERCCALLWRRQGQERRCIGIGF